MVSDVLNLPNGIPLHDTFSRVRERLGSEGFDRCFRSWVRVLAKATGGEVVAIDEKTVRRSLDKASG